MKKRRSRSLSQEEARLWVSIARTATPLKGKGLPDLPEEEIAPPPPPPPVHPKPPTTKTRVRADTDLPQAWSAPPGAASGPAPSAPSRLPPLHPIERPVRRKIGKGRIALDDRIDLHGQTEATAHGILLFFLRQAQVKGLRHVLVITGRGASFGSTGTLKRAMPHWFATGEFRSLVAGYEPAERGHGGEGAFYVRVRRK